MSTYGHQSNISRAGLVACVLTGPAWGATLSPVLVTGSDAIDPAAATDVVAEVAGSTPQATLEAVTGFGAVQNFTGATAGSNTFDLIGSTDFQTSVTGASTARSGEFSANDAFSTSPGGTLLIETPTTSSTNSTTVTIDFGELSGSVFDGSASDVQAAAFTITATAAQWDEVSSIVATFLDGSGSTLTTQTLSGSDIASGPTSGPFAYYFGFASDAQDIGSIEIAFNIAGDGSTGGPFGIDDIGFVSVIPEPASIALLGLGALMLRTRRRKP